MNQGSGTELYLQLLCFLPTLLKREGEPVSLKNVPIPSPLGTGREVGLVRCHRTHVLLQEGEIHIKSGTGRDISEERCLALAMRALHLFVRKCSLHRAYSYASVQGLKDHTRDYLCQHSSSRQT